MQYVQVNLISHQVNACNHGGVGGGGPSSSCCIPVKDATSGMQWWEKYAHCFDSKMSLGTQTQSWLNTMPPQSMHEYVAADSAVSAGLGCRALQKL